MIATTLVLATGFLGACNQSSSTEPASPLELDEIALSDRQIEILARASQTGQVTFEDYQATMLDTRQCVLDAGLGVSQPEIIDVLGVSIVRYWFTAPEGDDAEKWTPVVEACAAEFSAAVEEVYMSTAGINDRAIEFWSGLYQEFGPSVVSCLSDNGVTVMDPVDHNEWLDAAWELQQSSGVDCLEIVGWWDAATLEY